MNFRTYLRDLITRRQLTLSQIEMKSGIPSTYISQVLSGKRDIPSEVTLIKLAKTLGVPEREMLKHAGKAKVSVEEEFRKYLRELIDKNQLTLTQVEVRSGISNSYLSQILSGKRGIPPEETLRKLARSLGINEFEMLEKAGKLSSDFREQVQEYFKAFQPVADEKSDAETREIDRKLLFLSKKIKKARLEKGYTLSELSMTMCYPEELLRDIEEGKQYPGKGALNALSQALDKPMDYFQTDKFEQIYPAFDVKDYLGENFDKIQAKLDKLFDALEVNKNPSETLSLIKRFPTYSLSGSSDKDFFDDRRLEGYLLLPKDFFADVEVVILVTQTGLEPLISKGDRLLIKRSEVLEEEGQLCLFYDEKEKTYLVKRIYFGLESKLMAGLNRKEAIFNYYEERHREINILGLVKFLIRGLDTGENP